MMGGRDLLLAVAAVPVAFALGRWVLRSQGWTTELHRAALLALLLPWFAQHASIARLARSPSLNPLRVSAEAGGLLLPDVAAASLILVGLAACLVFPRRLRAAAVFLPVLAQALTWWVTLPLYAARMLRGWFFLTEGLAGPWPFAFSASASAFLAGYALRARNVEEPTGSSSGAADADG